MGAMKQWALTKVTLAEDLYTALADLVGDVEDLAGTGAFLSWRTPYGPQGSWHGDHGQIWLERLATDPYEDGTYSEVLVLNLDSSGDEEERVGLAHPATYHYRSGTGILTEYGPDTPQIYQAALTMLSAMGEEVREVLPYAREASEED